MVMVMEVVMMMVIWCDLNCIGDMSVNEQCLLLGVASNVRWSGCVFHGKQFSYSISCSNDMDVLEKKLGSLFLIST